VVESATKFTHDSNLLSSGDSSTLAIAAATAGCESTDGRKECAILNGSVSHDPALVLKSTLKTWSTMRVLCAITTYRTIACPRVLSVTLTRSKLI
jgi:hypothetical protein